MTPEEIENQAFTRARKGLDEHEVRSFLRRLADDAAATSEREASLMTRVAELEEQLRHPPVPSQQQLVDAVGEEVARALHSAQEAAENIRAKAEEQAARVVRTAEEDSRRLHEERGKQAKQDAQAVIDVARERGREMVAEARALRERVLADLNRRRDTLQAQLDHLRSGRDQLAEAYQIVKRMIGEANEALARFETGHPFDVAPVDAGPAPVLPTEPADEPAASDDLATAEVLEGEARGEAPSEAPEQRGEGKGAEAPEEPGEGEATETAIANVEAPQADAVEVAAAEPAGGAAEEGTAGGEPDKAGGQGRVEVSDRAGAAETVTPTDDRATETGATGSDGTRAERPDVDHLFARIRAGREETVAEARTVLAEAERGAPDVTSRPAAESGAPGVATEPELESASKSDAEKLAGRDELLEPVTRELLHRAKRVLQDEQNDLLDRLRQQGRRLSIEKLLPPMADRVEAWAEVMAPAIDQVYLAGRASAAPDRRAPSGAPQRMIGNMAEAVVGPLRERLTAAIGDALSAELDTDAIVQRIGARYREWKGQELDERIGDLLAAAYVRGVYDAVPDGSRLRWIPAEQGRCPDADDNALEPTLRGKRFPTGQQFPPAHPGCRCLLALLEKG